MASLYSLQIQNDEFHKKLGGGLPAGTIGLLKGDHGSGKSVICQRMVYGLINNDVSVSYISTQLTTTDFIKQMVSLGYNVIRGIIASKLKFFPVYPLISENKERSDYSKKLISSRHIFESEVVFIDSFSSLVRFDIDEKSSIDLMGFFKRIAATGKVIILTALEGELDKKTMDEVESAASLLIETSTKKFGADLKNLMAVKKYNFAQNNYAKQTAFRVEPKIGLVVTRDAVYRKGQFLRRSLVVEEIEGYYEDIGGVVTRTVFEWDSVTDTHIFRGLYNSYVLENKIAQTAGYEDPRAIYEEMELRKMILDKMVEQKIFAYKEVAQVIWNFYKKGIEGLPFRI